MTAPALSNRLADLAERIGERSRAVARLRREAAAVYLDGGRLLIEAKAECRHGEWQALLARAGVPERTARRMMQLARSGLDAERIDELGGPRAALDSLPKRKTDHGRFELAKPTAGQFLDFMAARTARIDAEGAGRVAVRREAFAAAVTRLREERTRRRAAGLPCGREALLPFRVAAAAAKVTLLREECAALAAGTEARNIEADMIGLLDAGEAATA